MQFYIKLLIKIKTYTSRTVIKFFWMNLIKEMLNKLREIHTKYQSFVTFEEPFVETFLSKGVS